MTTHTCPRCQQQKYLTRHSGWKPGSPMFPALSRTDNHTDICSDCGTHEALEWHQGTLTPQEMWPLDENLPWIEAGKKN